MNSTKSPAPVGLRRHRLPKPKQNNPLIQPLKSRLLYNQQPAKSKKKNATPPRYSPLSFTKKNAKIEFQKEERNRHLENAHTLSVIKEFPRILFQ